MKKDIIKRAKKIKLLATDVDGVLTGGEIIILNSGEELKIWSVKDRMGFALLKHSGSPIKMAWLTARKSKQVQIRAEEIGVPFIRQGCTDKLKTLQAIAETMKIDLSEIAYIGDDYVDYRPLKNVGLAVCPPEAPSLLKKISHYQTHAAGGKGVVREVIEILLEAQGYLKKSLTPFIGGFLISICLALSACSPQKPAQEVVEQPDQWLEQSKITETQSGVPVWILNFEIAKRYNRQKKITLENFTIEFMDVKSKRKANSKKSLEWTKKNQITTALLSAPKGEVNTENKNLVAWGGVEVEAQDGTVLTTERLLYSTESKLITTESPIRIVRDDSILIGEGLEATPDLSVVKIFRHEAFIHPKKVPVH